MSQNPRSTEIYDAMIEEMQRLKIEPTPDNQLSFLTGLRDGWKEDPTVSLEKSLYMITINTMLFRLQNNLDAVTP